MKEGSWGTRCVPLLQDVYRVTMLHSRLTCSRVLCSADVFSPRSRLYIA